MQCDLCHKPNATVHLTEIIDEQMTELHLCDECARKKSQQMEQQFGLSDLLGGLVEYGKQFAGPEKPGTLAVQCPRCGLTYEDFRKIGRLGCGECYVAFAKYLGPLLKRIHGAAAHTGKTPMVTESESMQAVPPVAKIVKSRPLDIADLKARLLDAIEKEEFEEAARLRDLIKEVEKKKKNGGKKDESG